MVRFLLLTFLAVMTSFPAWAGTGVSVGIWQVGGGHHHDRWSHGGGWGYPRHHYRPRSSFYFYSGPPAYPVYVAPPVHYYPAYPTYAPPARVTPSLSGQCTQFNGDATIDGSGTPFYGRACIFSDGRWHIVP